MNLNEIMTFGKYKNSHICKVFEDTNYYEWIMNQEIFLYCTGLCLLGIPSSIIAQYYKLCVIHQNLSMKIYKYDSIPNISILLCILVVLNYYEPYYIGLTYIYTGTITYIIYKRLYKKIISKHLN